MFVALFRACVHEPREKIKNFGGSSVRIIPAGSVVMTEPIVCHSNVIKGDFRRISQRPHAVLNVKKGNIDISPSAAPSAPSHEMTSPWALPPPPKKALSSIIGRTPHQSPLKPHHSFTTVKISRVISAERCQDRSTTNIGATAAHDLWSYPGSNKNDSRLVPPRTVPSTKTRSSSPVGVSESSAYPNSIPTSNLLQPLSSTVSDVVWLPPVARSPLADKAAVQHARHHYGPKSDAVYSSKTKHFKGDHIMKDAEPCQKACIYKSVDSSMSAFMTHGRSGPKSSPIYPVMERKSSTSTQHWHHDSNNPTKLRIRTSAITQTVANSRIDIKTSSNLPTCSGHHQQHDPPFYRSASRASFPIRAQSSLDSESSPFLVRRSPPLPQDRPLEADLSNSTTHFKQLSPSVPYADAAAQQSTMPSPERTPTILRTTLLSAVKSNRSPYPCPNAPATTDLVRTLDPLDHQISHDVASQSDDSHSTLGRESSAFGSNGAIPPKRVQERSPFGRYLTVEKPHDRYFSVSSHPTAPNEQNSHYSKVTETESVLARSAARRRPDRFGTSSAARPHNTNIRTNSSSTTKEEFKLTPMAVLLSLEGLKSPSHHSSHSVKYPNQDRAFIHEISPYFTVFAVFDGHGEKGHLVAQFVSSAFQKLLIDDFPSTSDHNAHYSLTTSQVFAWMKQAFTKVEIMLIKESNIDCRYSGSTASLGVRYRNSVLIGYIGDSKVAGFQFHGKKPLCLIETPDHSPASRQETMRIRKTGATVTETQLQHFSKPISRIVEAGLSLSRAFGDLAARQYGVISEPDFIQIDIPPRKIGKGKKKSSHFPLMLVVASDGFWDTIAPYEVLKGITNSQQSKQKLLNAAKQVAEYAWRRRVSAEGRADDTTVIVALLQ